MLSKMEEINLETATSHDFLERVSQFMMDCAEKGEIDVWNLDKPLLKHKAENKEAETPKILPTLSSHEGDTIYRMEKEFNSLA